MSDSSSSRSLVVLENFLSILLPSSLEGIVSLSLFIYRTVYCTALHWIINCKETAVRPLWQGTLPHEETCYIKKSCQHQVRSLCRLYRPRCRVIKYTCSKCRGWLHWWLWCQIYGFKISLFLIVTLITAMTHHLIAIAACSRNSNKVGAARLPHSIYRGTVIHVNQIVL